MEVKITKGQIEDIEVIAQFQVDMAMESEGTLLDNDTVTQGVSAAMNDENKGSYYVAKVADKGLEILDFPCNQFGAQAKGTDEEIQQFCILRYNTKFPRFRKIEVNGENELPLYTYLKQNNLVVL